jgi:flagellar motor component MotA
LVLSGAIVSLGAAIGGGESTSSWMGTPLVVLGSSCAAVCVTLWVVCALDPKRRAAQGDSKNIRDLVADLIEVANVSENRGVLALPNLSISAQSALYSTGAALLIAGESADNIRRQLAGMSDTAAEAGRSQRARTRFICDAFPILALSLSFSLVLWAVITIVRGAPIGTLMPLVLLGAVYGAFAIAALAVEFGDRLSATAAEDELAAALVIETLARIRSGDSADKIAQRLRGHTPGIAAPVQAAPLRKAA